MKVSLSNQILDNAPRDYIRRNKPKWLRAKMPGGPGYDQLRSLVDGYNLHTVCESARCPNLGECWERGTATMMILGDVCTRSCGFCHIKTGKPPVYDSDEPRRVGEAAAILNLKHLVITSVNRDELPDGGAEIWAETIRQVRLLSPGTQVEVLIPDFCGDWDALQVVLDERPEILNHNMETVPRLYHVVRPQAKYEQSIELLRRAKAQGLTVKTGIMVGIGETDDEIEALMRDVVAGTTVDGVNHDNPATNREHGMPPQADTQRRSNRYWAERLEPQHAAPELGQAEAASHPAATYPGVHPTCDILTIGQYLQPTRGHLPVTRFVEPAAFVAYKQLGEAIGFRHVESGPMVRSSYHADEQVLQLDAPATA